MNWKIFAIVLLVMLIAETIFFISISMIGGKMLENEDKCSGYICSDNKYDYYFYDVNAKLCYCYTGDDIALVTDMGKE